MIASTLSPNLARWLITNILRQVRGVRLRPLALIFTITLGLVAFARAGTFSFEPTDDAYLEGTTPFNDEFLRVATGSQVSYLKFTVSGLTGTIETATLRLQESDDAGSGTLRVFRGSHNSWTETTLSSDDAPVQDGELGSFTGTISNNEIVNVEITSLITGDGTYSVIISQDTGGNDVAFGSSESTTSPVSPSRLRTPRPIPSPWLMTPSATAPMPPARPSTSPPPPTRGPGVRSVDG